MVKFKDLYHKHYPVNTGVLYVWVWGLMAALYVCLLDFNGLYGQDAYEYSRFCGELYRFYQGGALPAECHFPVGYPLLGSLLCFALPPATALQLLSIFALMLTIFVSLKMADLLDGKDTLTTPLLLLGLGFSPFLLRMGICVMSDMLCTASFCCAFYFLLRWKKDGRLSQWLWFSVFVSAAVSMRYAAGAPLIPLSVLVLPLLWKRRQLPFLLFSALVFLLLLSPNLLLYKAYLQANDSNFWLWSWKFSHLFSRHFADTPDGAFTYPLPNLLFQFSMFIHPGFYLLGAVSLFFLRKSDFMGERSWIWIVILFYLLFLAGLPRQNVRFQVFIYPLILLLYLPASLRIYSKLIEFFKFSNLVLLGISLLCLSVFLCYKGTANMISLNRTEKEVVHQLGEYPRRYPVYTLGIEGAISHYLPDREARTLYKPDVSFSADTLLSCLQTRGFLAQWTGKATGDNYLKLLTNYRSTDSSQLSHDWQIKLWVRKKLP